MTRAILITTTALLAACGGERLVAHPPERPIEETHPQIKASKIDILFVIDNSRSMQEEQQALSENFPKFLEFVDPDPERTGEIGEVDYHLAITTTDASRTGGALVGSPQIIEPDGPGNPLTLFQENVQVGTEGGARETGFEAALAALANAKELKDHEGGRAFLRDGAYLYVIIVSDEDDNSFGEVQYYFRRFETLKGIGNDGTVAISAITAPTDGACQTALPGVRYEALARFSGGVIGDICDPDWSSTLRELAITGIGLKKRFQLDQPPRDYNADDRIDWNDIQVTVRYPCWVQAESPHLAVGPGLACADALDACEGADENDYGRACQPWYDAEEGNGWSFDPVQNTVVFHGNTIPGPGGRVELVYYPRTKQW